MKFQGKWMGAMALMLTVAGLALAANKIAYKSPLKLSAVGCQAFRLPVYNAMAELRNSYAALAARFAEFDRRYEQDCIACRNKTYTQQDMTAAGCLPSDTLEQCNQKLFNRCMGSISSSAGFLLLCGDVQKTAAAARELEDRFFNPK